MESFESNVMVKQVLKSAVFGSPKSGTETN